MVVKRTQKTLSWFEAAAKFNVYLPVLIASHSFRVYVRNVYTHYTIHIYTAYSSSGNDDSDNNDDYKRHRKAKIETISNLIIKIPSLIAVFCSNLIISRDNVFENFEFSHNRQFSHTHA